jgi:hypothetical protein
VQVPNDCRRTLHSLFYQGTDDIRWRCFLSSQVFQPELPVTQHSSGATRTTGVAAACEDLLTESSKVRLRRRD